MSVLSSSVPVPPRLLFNAMIRDTAARTQNRSAVLADSYHNCPYPELPRYLDGIRAFLRKAGVRPQECVTVELNNSVRSALILLALLDGGYSTVLMPIPGQGARVAGDEANYARFSRSVLTVNAHKPGAPLESTSPADFLSVRRNDAFDPRAALRVDAGPWFFYRTSGSLGASKLVMYSYKQLYLNMLKTAALREFDASHRVALPVPIYHGYGVQSGLLATLHGGASVDFQERSNVLLFLEREADFDPNVAFVTPSFCDMLVRARRSPRRYLYVFTGGDRLSEATFRRSEELHGPMLNGYGSSEFGMLTATDLGMSYELRSRTVGRPLPGIEVRLVPIEGDATPGQGELCVRTHFGFDGYVDLDGRPTGRARSADDGWWRTGDLAQEGPEGTLIVLGRCDISVNRQGVLLPLGEVESRLRALAGVQEAAAAPGPETPRGRAIVAFCVLADGSETDGGTLRSSYAQGVPAFAVPDVVRVVEALPKLGTGKLDRRALARMANSR